MSDTPEGFENTDDSRDSKRYPSLDRAFQDFRTPFENRAFIQRFTEVIGIESYHKTSSYIKAVRRDGKPDLQIYAGGTSGFTSVDEILAALGDVHRWPSQRHGGTLWGVTHPKHGAIPGENPLAGRSQTSYGGACPECGGGILSLSGECPICGFQRNP